jgi:hypothetical protein
MFVIHVLPFCLLLTCTFFRGVTALDWPRPFPDRGDVPAAALSTAGHVVVPQYIYNSAEWAKSWYVTVSS